MELLAVHQVAEYKFGMKMTEHHNKGIKGKGKSKGHRACHITQVTGRPSVPVA